MSALTPPEVADFTCSEHRELGTYTLPATCINCGWAGLTRWSQNHETDRWKQCPHCGCRFKLVFRP